MENIEEIKRRVAKAGVKDQIQTRQEPVGYGYVGTVRASSLDNLMADNQEFVQNSRQVMYRAMGYYKVNAMRRLNPIYWIEVVFYLPKSLVSATGIEVGSNAAIWALNIVQIVYWLLSIVLIVVKSPQLLQLFT